MRRIGTVLSVLGWGVLLYSAVGSAVYAQSHEHVGMTMGTEYTRPWPLALTLVVAILGMVLALVPLRRQERWALWTSLGVWAVLLVTRFLSDPRCLVVLDPHQHGCHTFMIAAVLGIIGLVMAR